MIAWLYVSTVLIWVCTLNHMSCVCVPLKIVSCFCFPLKYVSCFSGYWSHFSLIRICSYRHGTVYSIKTCAFLALVIRLPDSRMISVFPYFMVPLLTPLGTDTLYWCVRSTCCNLYGRLCRPLWQVDPGDPGRRREWVRCVRIAHWWALIQGGHVIFIQDWSIRTWRFPWSCFKACGAFSRLVWHRWDWC